MPDKSTTPSKHNKDEANSKRASRLRKRLREINSRGEKELAAIFVSIEKAKAAFRSDKT